MASTLTHVSMCCAQSFCKSVKRRVNSHVELLGKLWKRRLWAWVRLQMVHAAKLENRHAHNRVLMRAEATSWAGFSAKSVLAKSKAIMRAEVLSFLIPVGHQRICIY